MDRVVVITGASSGIGRQTALLLAERGDRLVLGARRFDHLQQLAREIGGDAGATEIVQTDVTDRGQIDRLVERAIDRWGRIDVVIANAAQFFHGPMIDSSPDQYRQAMAVNFHGTVDLIYAVLPHMIEQGSGHLVFVSTFDSKFGNRNEGPYVASKHAQAGFAEVARRELTSLGVTATTVLLGRVDTPMIDHLRVSPIQPKVRAGRAADVVVRAVERRPAQIVFPPVRGRLLLFVNTMFPALNDRLSRWLHLEGWDQPNR